MANTQRPLVFLSDIDGLRALAVVAVVLFHLQVVGWGGGYVGVDIFFVISGFLITGLLRQRIGANGFTFSAFYANRMRRLIPAVIATVAATALASAFILQPQMLKAFALSALGSLLSVANIVFFMEAGYWDANSDFKPLLHMWSLGVEEQFYLFWPALVVLLSRARRRVYIAGLVTLFGTSLVGCIIYTPIDSAATFYLLPFRVWQFCLGALAVEVWRYKSFDEVSQHVMRSLGLLLCAVAIFTFDDMTGFPGWVALVPSAGTALVLLAAERTRPNLLLSNPVARWLGKTSYSLYLAHWPPIALYRCLTLSEPDNTAQITLAAITFLLAILLHYGVEARFYRRHYRATGWVGVPLTAAVGIGAGALIMATAYAYPKAFTVRTAVLSPEQIEQFRKDRFQRVRGGCRIDQLADVRRCPQKLDQPILFLGNSHEPDAYNIIAAALGADHAYQFVHFGSDNGCGRFEIIDDWVEAANADCQTRINALNNSSAKVDWHYIVYGAHRHDNALKQHFLRILRTLKTRHPEVEVIGLSDYIRTKVDCASLINQFGSSDACKRPEHVEEFAAAPNKSRTLRAEFAKVTDHWVDKAALLCHQKQLQNCITATPEGAPMFIDRHHLTFEFATFVGNRLAQEPPLWLQRMRADSR